MDLDVEYGFVDQTMKIACGHCICCRIARAQEWTTRGVHEMSSTFHPTYAVTLTYDNDHLPPGGSLQKSDLQCFHKRLRYHTGDFRFMACGEYGPNTGRAHYHGVYFGLKLPDAYKGNHWGSRTLLEAWGNGQVSFHPATPASIGYVSGYVVKKLRAHHSTRPIMETVDLESGLILEESEVDREFFQASNKPGLGRPWIEQFYDQVLRDGFIVKPNGKKTYRIPKFYREIMRDLEPAGYEEFLAKRLEHLVDDEELTPEELAELGINVEREMSRVTRAAI